MRCPVCEKELVQVGEFGVCSEHGQADLKSTESSPQVAAQPHRVFISYGRGDAFEFAQRLAGDLKQRGGHHVWLDVESIEKGGLWEVRIEQGIRGSSVLAAVMTAHSLREGSVCRDEIVFALNEGKDIVPIKADADRNLKPSLLLARRNWIDFSGDYEIGLQSLLEFLRGNTSALRPPALPTITGLVPLDFGLEIARFTVDFTGRHWVNHQIDRWLSTDARRAMVMVAEPGMGKSAIAAWLTQARDDVIGIHFCTQQNSRTRDPYEFVASLLAQLHARMPGFAEALESKRPDVRRPRASDAFRELVVEVACSLPPQDQPRLIVVDSLDEALAQSGETILDVLLQNVTELPAWIRVVATTRPEEPILRRIRALIVSEMMAAGPENRADVLEYIQRRLESPSLKERLGRDISDAAGRIHSLSEGNFLYARMAVDALEDGAIRPSDLDQLSPGLTAFYYETFRRRFPDLDAYDRSVAMILRALSASRGPLPFALLQRISGEPAELVRRRLNELRSFFRVYGRGEASSYSFFHKSIRDWLTDPDAAGDYWCRASTGHAQLIDALRERWETEDYALRHLPAHLVEGGEWEQAAELLTDLRFLVAKVQRWVVRDTTGRCIANEGVYALQADLAETLRRKPAGHEGLSSVLGSFAEAVASVVGVLEEHPEQALSHIYAALAQRQPANTPVWDRANGTANKAAQAAWLKQINWRIRARPQTLISQLLGHSAPVTSLAVSPIGPVLASGDSRGELRLWDLDTGEILLRIQQRDGAICSINFSTDGRHLRFGVFKKGLYVWNIDRSEYDEPFPATNVTSFVVAEPARLLVAGECDGSISWWDLVSRQFIHREERAHAGAVECLTLLPDGERLLSGGEEGAVRLWDVRAHRPMGNWGPHSDRVRSLAVSKNMELGASGSRDRTIAVWNVESGKRISTLTGHMSHVTTLLFLNNDRLISGSYDTTIRLWNIGSKSSLGHIGGHERWIQCLAGTSDGERVISGGAEGAVKVWHSRFADDSNAVDGHSHWILDSLILPEPRRLISASRDRTIRVWDLEDVDAQPIVLCGHTGWVQALAAGAQPDEFLSGSDDGTVQLWKTNESSRAKVLMNCRTRIRAVVACPSRNWVAAGGYRGYLAILQDGDSADRFRTISLPVELVTNLAAVTERDLLVARCADRSVRLFSADSFEELARFGADDGSTPNETGGRRTATTVSCFSNATGLISGDADGRVRVWSVDTGQILFEQLAHKGGVRSACTIGNDQLLVTGGMDGFLRVWRIASGELITSFLLEATVLLVSPGGQSYEFFVVEASTPRPQVRLLSLSGW